MVDSTPRSGHERNRIKTLTQAALNADKTVEQVEGVLEGLGGTMKELNTSLTALNATVGASRVASITWKAPCPAWTTSPPG